jgi:predicted GH43/DUF377 family glycosyl hydrolase
VNLSNILSKFKGVANKKDLLSGLGIEQVGKSIYLFFKANTTDPKITCLARSIDGLHFDLVKTLADSYIPKKINPKYIKLLQPRLEYFDAGQIEIEGVIKINQGNLIVYHNCDWPSGFQVGFAIIKNGKVIFRCDHPLWESNNSWENQQTKFIGLAYLEGQIIGYWGLNDQSIEAVFYPNFTLRNPETTRNIKVKLSRAANNPIITPNSDNKWESSQTFNPGVILLDNKFHFLYRAIGDDGVSRLGYAVSTDGTSIDNRLPFPVFTHDTVVTKNNSYNIFPSGGSWSGAEDPRLVRVGEEDKIYATYTACDVSLRVGLTSITVDDFIHGRWNWTPPICISPPNQINKNWVIFPEKIRGHYAILHAITPNIHLEYFENLDFKGEKYINNSINPQLVPPQNSAWDRRLRGAGAPPLKTKYGWLLFYHAMNYKVGVMLLDLDDPTKIICKAKAPILESQEFYENSGFKPGIVYVSGAVIQDGQLFIYYGGADSYVCAASADLDEFLHQLRYQEKPILEPAKIIHIK